MKAHKTKLFIFFNNKKHTKMVQQIPLNQTQTGTLIIFDTVTGLPVPASFSDIIITGVNESADVTANPEASNEILFTGLIFEGTATIGITATAHYTNSNGVPVDEVKTLSLNIQVAEPAHATEFRIQF